VLVAVGNKNEAYEDLLPEPAGPGFFGRIPRKIRPAVASKKLPYGSAGR